MKLWGEHPYLANSIPSLLSIRYTKVSDAKTPATRFSSNLFALIDHVAIAYSGFRSQ